MNDFGFGPLVTAALAAFIIAPLGIWKLVEILIWLFSHVSWT